MKKYSTWILSIAASFFLSAGLLAQEKIEVSVKVTKDGKVVKDTTYQFEDASEAKHAMKMMEVMSGDDEHMEYITKKYTSAHSGSGEAKTMVFISEDGEKTEIKEIHADSLVWIEEKHGDGDQVKVMKYKIKEGEEPHGEHVIVMKSEDGNTFDILVDEDFKGGDVVKKKEVKVVVSADDDMKWHVEGDELIYDKDENVYIIKGDDEVKMKVMKIMEEEGEGEDVKVIVIKKDEKDHDHDMDHDHDEDHDKDHDVDVDVKVVKKKVKK
jgi:hypothetical protein